jgi:hypothetical protein
MKDCKKRIIDIIALVKDDSLAMKLIEDVLRKACQYVIRVYDMETALTMQRSLLDPSVIRQKTEHMDKLRSIAHDSLIDSIRICNRYLHELREFADNDFSSKKQLMTLISAIITDINNIPLQNDKNGIDYLNELVKRSDLYDLLSKRLQNVKLPQSLEILIDKSEDYRMKSYAELKPEQQATVRKINISLIALIYPNNMSRQKFPEGGIYSKNPQDLSGKPNRYEIGNWAGEVVAAFFYERHK